jgi:hypothetical protein
MCYTASIGGAVVAVASGTGSIGACVGSGSGAFISITSAAAFTGVFYFPLFGVYSIPLCVFYPDRVRTIYTYLATAQTQNGVAEHGWRQR